MSFRREMAVRLFALSMLVLAFGSVSVVEARGFRFLHNSGSSSSEYGSTCGTIVGLAVALLIIGFVIRALTEYANQDRGRRERDRPRRRPRRRDDDDDDWQPRTRSVG